jgi:lysophospholipase L1-like esterase
VRILCVGDSYTVGEGVHPDGSWPHLLAGRLAGPGGRISPVIVGRTGMTVADVHDALEAAAPAAPFDLVTLQAGVNDQYRDGAPARCAADFDRLAAAAVGLADGRPGRVIAVSIPDWSVTPHAADRDRRAVAEEIDRFNEALRSAAGRRRIRWVDVTEVSRACGGEPEMLAADGLHPSAAQYARWLERIEPAAAAALGDAAD